MRDIYLSEVSSKDFKNHEELIEAFKEYCIEVLSYDENDADIAALDLEDPEETEYIIPEFDCECTIDGKDYTVYLCHTDFCWCGLFHLANVERFEFYMLKDDNDKDRKVYLF